MADLNRELQRLRNKLARFERARDYHLAWLEANVERLSLRPLPPRPKALPRVHRRHEGLLVLADHQLGKQTASYDSGIARKRILALADPIKRLAKRWSLHKLHVALCGDLIEGDCIYPGQHWHIDSPAQDQATIVWPQACCDLLTELLGTFRVMEIFEAAGNHGRVAPKNSAGPERDNWDSVAARTLYVMLAEARRQGRVKFELNDTWWWHKEICGHPCFFLHGNQFQSLNLTSLSKRILGWQTSGAIPPWRYGFCGHWHVPQRFSVNDRYLWVSGSLDSDDGYALERLSSSAEPSQGMFIFHPRRGLVAEHMLRVEQ